MNPPFWLILGILPGVFAICFCQADNDSSTSANNGTNGGAGEVRAILERGRVAVDSIKRPVIGHASMKLEKYVPESPLMNFAADALLQTARECTGQHIDIAITNKGGLRSNINAGTVTFGDIYNVFPFENTLALLTLNGAQLMQLCREIYAGDLYLPK